jgi:formylglycine-generating enzyme required for sulfatase activity
VMAVAVRATVYPAILRLMARQSGLLVKLPNLDLSIETYEVTNERYGRCTDAGVCSEPLAQLSTFYQFDMGNYPVTGVDVWEASVFCDWIGRRLPTFDEWTQVTDSTRLPWGDSGPTPDQANLRFDPSGFPGEVREVGSFPSGTIGGIHDIIGNVSEWTRTEMDTRMRPVGDWAGTNPEATPSEVAIVGGSIYSTPFEPLYMNRRSGDPDDDIGFRCVQP